MDDSKFTSMPVKVTNDTDETRLKIFPSIEHSPPLVSYFVPSFQCGLTFAAITVVAIKAVTLAAVYFYLTSSHNDNQKSVFYSDFGSNQYSLRDQLKLSSLHARNQGAIQSMRITTPALLKNGTMEFLVSRHIRESGEVKSAVSTIKPEEKAKIDPFSKESLDKNLIVTELHYNKLDFQHHYTLVLNKFNTIPDHALIVTHEFELQSSPLSLHDLQVWYWCVSAVKAVGLYNSDLIAGASQRHKHMQIVPRDEIHAVRAAAGSVAKLAIPIDDVIIPLISSRQWIPFDPTQLGEQSEVYTLTQFKFKHGIAVLLNHEFWAENNLRSEAVEKADYGAYLEAVYLHLLNEVDLLPPCKRNEAESEPSHENSASDNSLCSAYNVILSSSWMMVVPRTQRDYPEVAGINGLGFIGLILAKDENAVDIIQHQGPLNILRTVTEAI